MAQKRIPCVVMAEGTSVSAPPPDGNYVVITHDNKPLLARYGFNVDNPFPWSVRLYTFVGGHGEEKAYGSSPGHILSCYETTKVFLIGLSPELRAQLDDQVSHYGVELVPEAAAK